MRDVVTRAEAVSREVDRCVEFGDADGLADMEFDLDPTPVFDPDEEKSGDDVRTSAAVGVDDAKLSDVAFGEAD